MNSIDLEDCIIATTWEKALELLNKKPSQKQIIEYTLNQEGVSNFWNAIYYYSNGVLVVD